MENGRTSNLLVTPRFVKVTGVVGVENSGESPEPGDWWNISTVIHFADECADMQARSF